jgi:acyl-CoA reductase-like NAD-dependent aldehyde dehydrogenase
MVQSVSIVNNFIINVNPATGDVISNVQCSSNDDIDEIIKQSKEAQLSWKAMPISSRIECLKDGLLELKQQSTRLIEMIVQEMGKPIQEATEEVIGATSRDEYMTILEESLQPQQFGSSTVVRHPYGVVAIFSPWNFPVDEILLLALPALASGNTVIVKPSEVVPETGSLVVSALASKLPRNVIQLVQGDGAVGSIIVQHSGIDMIAMTGSSATGHKIIQQSISADCDNTKSKKKMKRFVLEMGGKDPMIIFEDADLDLAVKDAVAYSLSNTGQVCCSIERVFVAQPIYATFQKKVIEEAKKYKVGNGMDPTVSVGPMVSVHQCSIVQQQVSEAIKDGAKLLYQSDVPTCTSSEKTSFYPVTVISDVTEGMSIYKDETFGPVITLIPFDGSEDRAIELANDTEYGLAGSVYSVNVQKAQRVADQIDAGQVGINCYSIEHMNVACPWVGHKNSGFGFHSGRDGIHNFSIPKSIVHLVDV